MRICIVKATKRIIEMQGGGKVDRLPREHESFKTDEEYAQYLVDCDILEAMRLNTLKQNALNAGYAEADIEVKWINEAEYETAKLEDPVEIANKVAQAAHQELESLIQAKVREQAITALKAEGKLDKDGKIVKVVVK